MVGSITPEQARAELARRRSAPPVAPAAPSVTPDAARAELARRKAGGTPDMGALNASVTTGGQGLTLGFGDEIFGALATPIELGMQAYRGDDLSIPDAYAAARDKARGARDQAREQHPVAAAVGEFAGAAALPAGAARSLPGLAVQGAGTGAAYGFGATDGGLQDRAEGAGLGAAGGLAGAVVAKGIGNFAAKAGARRAIPSADEVKTASRAAYDRADTAGLTMAQSPTTKLVTDLDAFAKGEGLDKGVHPRVTAAMTRLGELDGTTPNLTTLDNVRKVLGAAAKSPEPDERRIASMVIDRYDDYLEGLTPKDVVAGNAKAATEALAEARSAWRTYRKSETIENIFETAKNTAGQYSVSGMENALRTGFRQLANNPKRLRAFNDAEKDAIRGVARGGAVTNAMRLFGKLAIRGPVSAIPTLGAVTAGNPVLGAGMAALGEAAKFGAARRTIGAARSVDEMIRSGGESVPDLVRMGRQGQGIGALPVQRAQALENSLRLPLSALGGAATVQSR